MSHDRGCFKCGKEQWEYRQCAWDHGERCVKRGLVKMWGYERDKSWIVPRTPLWVWET